MEIMPVTKMYLAKARVGISAAVALALLAACAPVNQVTARKPRKIDSSIQPHRMLRVSSTNGRFAAAPT